MKKTMKKLLVSVLCVIMLMTSIPLQSFAAFGVFEKPEIKDVSLSQHSKISVKELNNYFDTIYEVIDYYNKIFDEQYTLETLPDEIRAWILNYYLSDTVKEAEYIVTFTNGDTLTVDADSYITEINSNYSVTIDGWIEYEDYLFATQNNKDTVEVTIEAEVYSTGIFSSYEKIYNFNAQAFLVDCFVKSFKPVSGVPEQIYEEADYIELEGAQFSIEYGDGTKKVAQVSVDNDGYDMLDGCEIEFYEEDSVLYVYFLDEVYEKNISHLEFPFEKIEFLNYEITNKNTTVDYRLYRKDGTVTDYTKSLSNGLFYGVVDELDGYYIRLTPFNDSIDVNDDESIKLYISAGELYSNGLEYEIELPPELSFIAKIIEKLQSIIDFFRNLFASLFSKIGLVA